MENDFSSLAAKIAADLPGLRGCVIVSRDGLVLGAYPQDGERILRPAWLRFASLGEVEKGFIQFPGELWVYVRNGPYASFATSEVNSRPGLLLDAMDQALANAEEARATGVTLPESPVVSPPQAPPQAPMQEAPAQPPMQAQPQAPPVQAAPQQPMQPPPVAPQAPPQAPQVQPQAPAPPQPVPQQMQEPAPQAPPQAPQAPQAPPPAQAPPEQGAPVPVPPAPEAGYHADYTGGAPSSPAPAPVDPTASGESGAALADIQIDRVALAQEFASLLAETGYDDEDDSA